MKFLLAAVATLALAATTAVGQQQYPQSSYPQNQYPQTTTPQSQYPQTNNDPQQNTYPQSNTSAQTNSQYGPQTETVNVENGNTLPAGTQLTIRTNDQITADANSVGQTYTAEVANNIADQNGRIIIPIGSPAQLAVSNVGQGTMGVGSNEVALTLQSISVNGNTYTVQSNSQTQSGNRGIGANKRTAEMTGGGAVLGAVIGAVAGGAKGAVLGGILGAGAGGAAQVLTRGKQVNVPAETLLRFQLNQPVSLNNPSNGSYNNGYPQQQYPPQR